MANVLSTLEDANILASGGSKLVFTTASTGVSPVVATASGSFPTAAVFTTAIVATPKVTRSSRGIVIEPSSHISVNIPSINKKDNGKGIMTEPEKNSKEKVIDQMSAQLAKELEEEFALEDQRIREQAERDSEIVRIHAQQELDMMIAELDRSNEMVAKHLSEYEQAEAELSHNEKVELINELLKYQRDLAQIKKYQAQQSKLTTKTERRKFYTSVLRSSAGIQLAQKSSKKLKTAKASGSEISQEQQTKEPKEISEEKLKKMMEIVPTEKVYIEALQVKRPIIDWEVYALEPGQKDFQYYRPYRGQREDALRWKLSCDDTCGMFFMYLLEKGTWDFQIVEKGLSLTKGLTTVMMCTKLQVDQYSKMANELLMKIYSIANSFKMMRCLEASSLR
ncbi:hypothetical protein Tco_1132959 [Tanacetum coccineum]|uniref:Uncharacterized protein n=1 Tax=Tanacetum coccineum TaxID=301880 RepID=A0ABQ5JGF9_9ASTR